MSVNIYIYIYMLIYMLIYIYIYIYIYICMLIYICPLIYIYIMYIMGKTKKYTFIKSNISLLFTLYVTLSNLSIWKLSKALWNLQIVDKLLEEI